MKTQYMFSLAFLLSLLLAAGAGAQDFGPEQGSRNGVCQFIDEDGDGFNDLAPDADGDGIPNGLDPDYVKPEDGTGSMNRWAGKYGALFQRFFGVDVVAAMNQMERHQYGPGDGAGTGFGPGDGTGFGPGTSAGSGPGDGEGNGSNTAEQTQQRRGGRR